ncbi:MAG: sialidase family protein [Acidobacteria bacterium]|nr:sialidase family protein [Acidobacteriota bacterium]
MLALACCLGVFLPLGRAQPPPEPGFETIHVVKMPVRQFGYRGMPGDIELLKDGRLLLSYVSSDPEGAILARHSGDKGKSWGPEFVLFAKPTESEAAGYGAPSFLRLASGDLLASYIYAPGATPRYGHNYYRRSRDDGKTWSEQFVLTPFPGYNLVHNDKLIELSTGRIIAPLEMELREEGGDHRGYVSYTFHSDDNGVSWRKSQNMVDVLPVEAQEPHVVELKDGRLMMLCRTYSGYVVRSYSADQGESWSPGEHLKNLSLPPNSSALNVKRIPSTGDPLLLRCSGGANRLRTPFVSAISKDDGESWTNQRTIGGDPEDDYGYPSLLFVDGLAIISYHQRDGLHVARIPIEWFYK